MAGTVGVVDGVAMYTGDGINDGIYYLNEGGINLSNTRAQIRVAAIEEDATDTAGVAIRFRRADEDNWWEFGMSPDSSEYILRKNVAGVLFTVHEPGLTRGSGDILKVETYEQRINCYLNETLITSIEDTDLQENETVGIRFSAGCVLSAVDDFYALILTTDIRDLLTFSPTYEIFVDWDNDGGLNIGDFETTTDGWIAFGTNPPDIDTSNLYIRSGFISLHVQWNNWNLFRFDTVDSGFDQGGFGGPEYNNPPIPFKFNQAGQGFDDGYFAVTKNDAQPVTTEPAYVQPGVYKVIDRLVPGREYTLKAWIYIPSNSPGEATGVSMGISGISGAVTSTLENEWEHLSFTYIATAEEHTVAIYSTDLNPGWTDECFVDEVMNIGAYEDISCYVLNQPINFRYGRDQARSLASISPGDVEFELNNEDAIFSPDNPGSVLFGYLAPGKPMLMRATYNNQTVNLFHGFVDNYTLHPDKGDQYVTMTCMDVLQYLANATMDTELYPSIQTGEAISVILDSVNWPEEKRDIDQGATTVRWWCEEGSTGLEAVQALVESEGLPSIAYVDAFGNFVFRSRHHRFLQTASKSIQAFIRSDKEFDEPNFSGPVTYDIGWKDIINQIKVDIDELVARELDEVWSEDDLISITAGETYTVNVKTGDAFFNAVLPTVEDEDIVLKTGSGSLASVNMTRTSGKSTTLTLTAGASAVLIKRLRLRANSVDVGRTKKIIKEDSTSITTYGPQSEGVNKFPWVNVNDMDAIADIILGQRAERLPVVYINLNHGHPIRLSHILNRKLSDRIHLQEMLQTFMNDDYFIEVLEHEIKNSGTEHTLTLGCEKAREQLLVDEGETPPPTFTFDVAGQGFDDGYFQSEGSGFTLSGSLFILDQSNLDEDGLGF